jgi:hypothetical protein
MDIGLDLHIRQAEGISLIPNIRAYITARVARTQKAVLLRVIRRVWWWEASTSSCSTFVTGTSLGSVGRRIYSGGMFEKRGLHAPCYL